MERLKQFFDLFSAKPRTHQRLRISIDENGKPAFYPDDPDNPHNWSIGRKSYLTGITMLLVVNATFSSSAPTGAIEGISEKFQVSTEAANLVTTLFLFGYVAGPLFWAPLSEFYGRRWIFYISFIFYITFNILCAFTPNFGGLLVGRFISSVAASAALSNGPGLISDLWGPVGRGNAMVLFMAATFCGPALGPVVAGFLQVTKGSQAGDWTFYVLLMLAAPTLVLVLTIPETLPSVILSKKGRSESEKAETTTEAEGKGTETLLEKFKAALTRPWLILFDPISFCIAMYYCVVYTLLYMLFSIYPIVFQQKRGWNAGVGELPLIGVVIGACLGGLILFYISTKQQKATKEGRPRIPEDRLPPAMIAAILFPASMFWFAWTAEFNSIHWIVPTLAGTFLSTAILLIFAAFINYLVDSYVMYAASAVAANTVTRSACAAASPLFTQYMFDTLGVSGGGSLIAGVGVLLAPIPFVFYRYGASIRRRSKFAPESTSVSS